MPVDSASNHVELVIAAAPAKETHWVRGNLVLELVLEVQAGVLSILMTQYYTTLPGFILQGLRSIGLWAERLIIRMPGIHRSPELADDPPAYRQRRQVSFGATQHARTAVCEARKSAGKVRKSRLIAQGVIGYPEKLFGVAPLGQGHFVL